MAHAVAEGRDEAGLSVGAREGTAGGVGARAKNRGAGRESIVRGRAWSACRRPGGHSRVSRARDRWDADPWLLGTPDGVIDLRDCARRGRRAPEDYITRLTTVAPAASEDCPLWMAFLSEATGNDADMTGFLQRWFGYCLTGITREHALVCSSTATAGNGKGVLSEYRPRDHGRARGERGDRIRSCGDTRR